MGVSIFTGCGGSEFWIRCGVCLRLIPASSIAIYRLFLWHFCSVGTVSSALVVAVGFVKHTGWDPMLGLRGWDWHAYAFRAPLNWQREICRVVLDCARGSQHNRQEHVGILLWHNKRHNRGQLEISGRA